MNIPKVYRLLSAILFFISVKSFAGIGRQAQCLACSKCHLMRSSVEGFFGIRFWPCQSLFIFVAIY
jgi:hypothetical protein